MRMFTVTITIRQHLFVLPLTIKFTHWYLIQNIRSPAIYSYWLNLELPSSVRLFRCIHNILNCNVCEISWLLCIISNTDINWSKNQLRVIYLCLNFGGQNHVLKTVIKIRTCCFCSQHIVIHIKLWPVHKAAYKHYLHTPFKERAQKKKKAWKWKTAV